ncbi:MAG TPA: GNAT family N-acetyltransferase [Propionibacteriaceae bacterium]|nr:GNAT family N-acetyltransferase [Propionibacteriaceae bacterium]
MEELDTDRLRVRRFRPSDAAGLYAYLSNPEAVRFEPYGVQSEQDCRRLAAERSVDPAFWAVCLRGTGELVGNLYLSLQEPKAWRTYELGYVFNPAHWGRGYATEAAAALVSACFASGAHRVIARCNPQNEPSWRLLERLGFRREGHFLQSASFTRDDAGEPVWHDAYLYATLADEWVTTPLLRLEAST